ncbi:LysM peptidoglycan-binding domain-containing protein [Kocuria sp. NPDC057446]|uniref:LysM peptidoglycan-binding domain-containing protein n=1 Tax=Kocuria sp. NPDC057446 TaxID=3346137 RepID=UPI00368CB5AE
MRVSAEFAGIPAAPMWPVLLVPAVGAATGACGAVLVDAGGRLDGGADAGVLIGVAAATIGCAVVLAWTLSALLALLAVLAGRHRWERLAAVCARCSPALLRRAAAAALGLQLFAAPGAVADDTPSPFWETGTSVQESTPGPAGQDTVPDATASPPEPPEPAPGPGSGNDRGPGTGTDPAPRVEPAPCPARAGSPVAERTVDGAVTVVRGDTLWSLAAAQLGPEASEKQVARAWPAWYELNRHVLTDGPHRLLPGQRLLVPGGP